MNAINGVVVESTREGEVDGSITNNLGLQLSL
jgi:hypothetical protein